VRVTRRIIALGVAIGMVPWIVMRRALTRAWPRIRGTLRCEGLYAPVTVLRDRWGVAHIYAANAHDLFFAQGFVHAQDRFWQMELERRLGEGRLAELFGRPALAQDRLMRTLGAHHVAAREVDLLDKDERFSLEAYSSGVNAYLRRLRGRPGLHFDLLRLTGVRYDPEPWSPYHTLLWGKVMAWQLSGNLVDEMLRAALAGRLGAERAAELTPPYPADHPVIVSSGGAPFLDDSLPHEPWPELSPSTLDSLPWNEVGPLAMGARQGTGSNNWVIAGSRTTTGRPLLANDPHLTVQIPSLWYEVALHCPPIDDMPGYHVVGASFPGLPGVVIGHNERIAWGVTNAYPDVQDLYIERQNPDHPDQYLADGRWVDMEIVDEAIHVADMDEPISLRVRRTRHGPIINDNLPWRQRADWQPLALRWVALDPAPMVGAILRLNRAGNWDEFRRALRTFYVPSQNFVYADIEGHIGYQMPGRVPLRRNGNGATPVGGWDGSGEWMGYVPYEDLPYLYDPPGGYIVTANNAAVGPTYRPVIAADWSPGHRAQRITALIESQERWSPDDARRVQLDDRVLHAPEILPHLLNLSTADPCLRQALDLLRRWDMRARVDSVGATLFEALRIRLIRTLFDEALGSDLCDHYIRSRSLVAMQALVNILQDERAPWYPLGADGAPRTRQDVLLEALSRAVDDLAARMGKDVRRWRWGALHTALFCDPAMGYQASPLVRALLNRGPVAVGGSCETVNNAVYDPCSPFGVVVAPSYRQIIDVGAWGRSVSIHTTGQSGHPGHRHYDDMITLWAAGEYHPMFWATTPDELLQAAGRGVRRLVLRP
jgi:penicillin amidase